MANVSATTGSLDDLLFPDEPLRTSSDGQVLDDGHRRAATIGVTDRRLICGLTDGTFAAVRLETIASVRSEHSSTLSLNWRDPRIPLGFGLALFVGATLALLLYIAGNGVPTVTALGTVGLAVGGVVALETVRRLGFDIILADVLHRAPWAKRPLRSLGVVDRHTSLDGRPHRTTPIDDVDRIRFLFLTLSGTVAVAIGVAGLVIYLRSGAILALSLAIVLGLAMIDHALRTASTRPFIERVPETLVSVHTVDGHSMTVAVDPSTALEHELARAVGAVGPDDD